MLKNWCFWTVVLKKTLESPLDSKEIKPVHPKGNQSWIFIGRTDAEAETPNFGHLMWRTDSFEKTLMLGKIEGGRRRGWTEGEMVGWHHQLDGHWVWASSWSWWRTGKPGVLQSLGSQRVRHDWTTELNWQPQTNSFNHVRLRFSSWVVSSLSLQIWELPQRKKHIHVDLI